MNRMLDEIDSLSKEIQLTQKQKYEIEIAEKQMEISAFRNQINPHFLYNTLECIRALTFYYKVQGHCRNIGFLIQYVPIFGQRKRFRHDSG